tara:strand:+ start:3133 stop:3798 length:666 start_codon:yes stop_codon:yes gene_type:complete
MINEERRMENVPTELSQLGTGLAQAAQRLTSSGGAASSEFPYLKMTKDRQWVFGADANEVIDSLWAVNPNSFTEGFIAWGDGEVLGEEMQAMGVQNPIIASNLPEVASQKGWEKQVGFHMKAIAGEFTGQQVIYKTSSTGGVKATAELVLKVYNQIQAGDGDVVPVVDLQSGSYKHKKYGVINFPVFNVDHWQSMGGNTDEAPEDETPPQDAPKRRRKIAG